jgi:hypothetical protein
VTEIVTVEGAVPLVGVAASQAPPSAVLVAAVQFKVPAPPFPTLIVSDGGLALVGLNEKLVWPGKLSKNALPEGTTAKLTGTVIDLPGLANSMMLISPV